MTSFPAIRIEGGLLGPDVLDQLLAAELPGQRPADFGLDGRRSLTDEIAAAFADARTLWGVFQHRLGRLAEEELATSETREYWVIPFLRLLGYDLHYNPRAYEVDGLTFAISHRAGEADDAPPVHIVGARQELGRSAPTGRPRLAPHSLVQEYLNRTEHLWGTVTNGRVLRLLRDSTYVRRQAYVEFDLEAIFEQQLFQDFAALFRLLHRTRLPRRAEDASDCWLERYYQHSIEQGGRVRDRLRDGVEECLKRLANGFLKHPANTGLRERIANSEGRMADGDNGQASATSQTPLTAEELYRQLLRLVYRFLFLLVSEDRDLISRDQLYRDHYGVGRLRKLLGRRSAYTEHDDLWHSLRVLWKVLSNDQLAPHLQLAPLNGELFAPIVLDGYIITNRDLLEAFWHLAYYQESPSQPPRRVNYAALDVEELGSVYESLLEYHPQVTANSEWRTANSWRFDLVAGSERKSTGSYYTPPELVAELIRSALEPVIEERLKAAKTPGEKEKALLSIRVCDPAAGSGHFLLAAARRLGKELARIRTGEDEPAPERVREAIRDVVAHCIYGVDKNPLAVELCRVALWLEAHCEGKPLTLLDHRIKCGDSLVGVLDLRALKDGIPDEAFEPVSGDDKAMARSLKRWNKAERSGQWSFPFDAEQEIRPLTEITRELEAIPDDTPAHIREKAKLMAERDRRAERERTACNLWTAAFFQRMANSEWRKEAGTQQPFAIRNSQFAFITTDTLRRFLESGVAHGQALGMAGGLAAEQRFFHWPLEFPEVFTEGGFDVVLGNPPWERIKLQEQEFFASRDRQVADAPNAAARKRLIAELPKTNPALWEEYRAALHAAEGTSRFLRGSGQYPLTGRGDINTYSVFAERMRRLLKPGGRAGVIVPTGIATDDTNKHFFADLVDSGSLVSLYDFENREGLFPGVHRSYKFSLLTMAKPLAAGRSPLATFAFFCTRADHLRDDRRRFSLAPDDIARLNPNTRTLPVFRTRQDAELTKSIYGRVPVLVNERMANSEWRIEERTEQQFAIRRSPFAEANPWGVRFFAMFHMSNDSHLFRTAEELEEQGFRRVGNGYVKGDPHSPSAIRYSPLYEAKMIWHYDHRYGTYEGVASRSSTQLPTPTDAQHADPHYVVQPWYWVPQDEVEARLGDWKRGWLLGFRDVARSTDERTAIFSLLPRVGVGNNTPILLINVENSALVATMLANLGTVLFDYSTRQKIAGVHMNFFFVQQLPVLPPSAYTPADLLFIVPRVLELVYTSWDMQPFAEDVWREANSEWPIANSGKLSDLQVAILRQWQENARETGNNAFELPNWASVDPKITSADPSTLHSPFAIRHSPLQPFRWDPARRACIRAELDAYYARLYGLTRKQLRYILDPADLTEKELEDILDPWEEVRDPLDPAGYAERCAKSTFPGETFRVLKEKEIRQFGEYRTRRLVLEAWERTRNIAE